MPKNGKHTHRPSVRNQMSHAEIMDKRYLKRKKKQKREGFVGSSQYHLKEYMKLTDNEEVSKKSIARSIMDIVEEINDEGMNDKRYLDIMDQLMSLHKEGGNSRKDYLINSGWNSVGNPMPPYIDGSSFGRTSDSIGQFGFGSRMFLTYLNERNTLWSD